MGLYCKIEDEIREQNPERTKVLFSIKNLLEYYASGMNTIFTSFKELKNALDYTHISSKQQLSIFVMLTENNGVLGNHKYRNAFFPGYNAITDREYKHTTSKEVTDLILSSKLIDYLVEENPENPEVQREIYEAVKDKVGEELDTYLVSYRMHCLFATKVYDLNEDSFASIRENMETLGFSSLSDLVIKQMKKNQRSYQREQEQKNSKKEKVSYQDNNPIQEQETSIKQTSLNQTRREINKYFDLDTGKLKEELSLDQIIYVLSLMYSIDIESDKIEVFLRCAMREFKNFHPYVIYHQGYDKFAFLADENPDVQEHLDMIEYILSDTNIFICSDDEYTSTKELVEEEINEIIRLTSGNYAYETKEAKNLLKINN